MNDLESHLKDFFLENKERINDKIRKELQEDFQNLMEWYKEFCESKFDDGKNPITFDVEESLTKILNHFYSLKETFLAQHYTMIMGAIKKEKN